MKKIKSIQIRFPAVQQGNEDLKAVLVPAAITLIPAFILWYFILPPINVKSLLFWFFLILVLILYTLNKMFYGLKRKAPFSLKRPLIAIPVIVAFILVTALVGSSKLFHAKKYSQILEVTEDTIDIIPSASGSSSIALMDTASAERLGDRRIGSLSSVVSQFNVGDYMQINYQDSPVKVAPLRYDGFFKYRSNRDTGIPGYVVVDPVDMSADYISLKEGMRYVPSAYFSKDLYRRIRFAYPTLMVDNIHFEIDEEGNPWYVASIYDHAVGLFGGETVTGALVIDPVSGKISRYSIDDVPVWADVVFPGDLICDQYNNHSQLQHGFLNSIFSQKDCRQVTTIQTVDEDGDSTSYPDYGYIAKDGDIWIYTGITSVNGDSSNLGFILANERTSETRYVSCAGADEFSGMKSAEGEVQEKGYIASFPSLINIDNTPTYIMVLKDANGLVKMYAAVNVEQYNVVATASTQSECIAKYKALLAGDITSNDEDIDVGSDEGYAEKTITVAKMQTIDQNGNTWLYIVDTDSQIYKAKYADVLDMLLVNEGDTITILTNGETFKFSLNN